MYNFHQSFKFHWGPERIKDQVDHDILHIISGCIAVVCISEFLQPEPSQALVTNASSVFDQERPFGEKSEIHSENEFTGTR